MSGCCWFSAGWWGANLGGVVWALCSLCSLGGNSIAPMDRLEAAGEEEVAWFGVGTKGHVEVPCGVIFLVLW